MCVVAVGLHPRCCANRDATEAVTTWALLLHLHRSLQDDAQVQVLCARLTGIESRGYNAVRRKLSFGRSVVRDPLHLDIRAVTPRIVVAQEPTGCSCFCGIQPLLVALEFVLVVTAGVLVGTARMHAPHVSLAQRRCHKLAVSVVVEILVLWHNEQISLILSLLITWAAQLSPQWTLSRNVMWGDRTGDFCELYTLSCEVIFYFIYINQSPVSEAFTYSIKERK